MTPVSAATVDCAAVDFDLSADQQALRDAAASLLDGMAGPDGDLRSAWKAQLEREGKLGAEGGSIRDLILGNAQAR